MKYPECYIELDNGISQNEIIGCAAKELPFSPKYNFSAQYFILNPSFNIDDRFSKEFV